MRTKPCRMENCYRCPNKGKFHLYLSHPVSLRKMVRLLELYIEKNSNIELLNPFYDAERKEIIDMDNGVDVAKVYSELNPHKIVEDDIILMDWCDGIVSFLGEGDAKSFGTVCEIWDAFLKGKPVYIITHILQNHPWVRYVTEKSNGKIFSSWDEFMQYATSNMFEEHYVYVRY